MFQYYKLDVDILLEYMSENNLNIKEFAKQVGVDRISMQNWLKRKNPPSLLSLGKLKRATGLSYAELTIQTEESKAYERFSEAAIVEQAAKRLQRRNNYMAMKYARNRLAYLKRKRDAGKAVTMEERHIECLTIAIEKRNMKFLHEYHKQKDSRWFGKRKLLKTFTIEEASATE